MAVHSLPVAVLDAQAQRTWSGRAKMALIMLVCAAPVVASYLLYFVLPPSGPGVAYSALIVPSVGIPELAAHDLDGRKVALGSLKGQWLLVVVGAGSCDTACEQRLFMQRQLREIMGRERDRIDKIWLIPDESPMRPELRRAIESAPPVRALRISGAALAQWLRPGEGHSLEDHIYLVDPMGEWMMRAPVDPDPSKLKRDLERLLRASAAGAVRQR
jgi:hypothetical protein